MNHRLVHITCPLTACGFFGDECNRRAKSLKISGGMVDECDQYEPTDAPKTERKPNITPEIRVQQLSERKEPFWTPATAGRVWDVTGAYASLMLGNMATAGLVKRVSRGVFKVVGAKK